MKFRMSQPLEPEREPSSSQNSSLLRSLYYILLGTFGVWLFSKLRIPPNEQSNSSQHPQGSSYDATQGGRNISSPIHVVVDAGPPTPTSNREQESRDKRDKKRLRIEKWTAFLLLAYTVVNSGMWWATKKSADAAKTAAETAEKSFKLARQRAEDSEEAICSVRGETENGSGVEHLTISNSGKVPAHSVEVHLEVSRNGLPGNERLTLFQALDISQDELRGESPILKDVVLSDFGESDWKKINQIREAVVVSGRIQYENGFGNLRHSTFCQAFLSQPANPGDSPQTPLHILVDCDRLPAFLPPLYERLRKRGQH
jgi:hypothetical protein